MSDVSTLKDFQKKYYKEISGIAKQQGKDLGVATDMFFKDISQRSVAGNPSEPVRDYYKLRADLLKAPEKESTQRAMQPDYRAVATQQVTPGFTQAQQKLQQEIEGTRRALPQALGARGQAVGGLRLGQEDMLTRDLAYGTADIEADKLAAIAERTGQLEQQAYQQGVQERQLGLQERGVDLSEAQFAELVNQNEFNKQVTLQGLATEAEQTAYNRERDTISDEIAKREFDESVRQFGLNYALQKRQEDRLAKASATQPKFDTRPYEAQISQLTPEQRIPYINNLVNYGVPIDAVNQLKSIYGIVPQVSPPPTGTIGIEGYQPVTETIISPVQQAEQGFGLDDYEDYIYKTFYQRTPVGTTQVDYQGLQNYLSQVPDQNIRKQLSALFSGQAEEGGFNVGGVLTEQDIYNKYSDDSGNITNAKALEEELDRYGY